MVAAICAETLTDAWLLDLVNLTAHGREQLNLVTSISDPDLTRTDARVIAELNDRLLRRGKQRVETVANTIFPSTYLRGCASREQFYKRYLARLPRLRKLKGNGQGTYFGRLISYPVSAEIGHGESTNQIETIILKLQKQLQGRGPKRFAYQAQIFAPGRDDSSLMGFPCLSFVSFQLEGRHLCLTAIYRNQYYFERALGNFIGLARLQRFIAEQTGLGLGSLTVHACHAELDLSMGQANKMLQVCQEIAAAPIAA
jgi:thymidylate synthase